MQFPIFRLNCWNSWHNDSITLGIRFVTTPGCFWWQFFSTSCSSILAVEILATAVLNRAGSCIEPTYWPTSTFHVGRLSKWWAGKKKKGSSWQWRVSSAREINVNAPLLWKRAGVLELVYGPFGDKAGMNLLFVNSLTLLVTESWLYLLVSKRILILCLILLFSRLFFLL